MGTGHCLMPLTIIFQLSECQGQQKCSIRAPLVAKNPSDSSDHTSILLVPTINFGLKIYKKKLAVPVPPL